MYPSPEQVATFVSGGRGGGSGVDSGGQAILEGREFGLEQQGGGQVRGEAQEPCTGVVTQERGPFLRELGGTHWR